MSDFSKPTGKPPEKGSKQWVKNESAIAKNPLLRELRDTSEGFKPGSTIRSAGFGDNYDLIDFSKKDTAKKGYRVKVNGRYVDEDEEE